MHVRHFWVVYSLVTWLDFLILLLYKTDKTWASISFSFEWLVARYVGAYLWEILWYGIHCHNLFPVVCAFYSLSIDPLGLVSLKAVFSHSLCALGLSQLLFSLYPFRSFFSFSPFGSSWLWFLVLFNSIVAIPLQNANSFESISLSFVKALIGFLHWHQGSVFASRSVWFNVRVLV